MNPFLLFILVSILAVGCGRHGESNDRFFAADERIMDVSGAITPIVVDDILGPSTPTVIGDMLVVNEWQPSSYFAILVMDRSSFRCLARTAILGKGPNEVIRAGKVSRHIDSRRFWLNDNGRSAIWEFSVDSLLNNPTYKPTRCVAQDRLLFIDDFYMCSDSVMLGLAVHPTSTSSFEKVMVKLSLNKGAIGRFGYEYPGLSEDQTKSAFAFSEKQKVYARAYTFCDMLTLCNADGSLRCNVKGANFDLERRNTTDFFTDVQATSDYFVALYNGGHSFKPDKHQRMETTWPTRLLVFDIDGRHRATIETGHEIVSFCIDEENHRVICYFNNTEHPLGYFSFDFEQELE